MKKHELKIMKDDCPHDGGRYWINKTTYTIVTHNYQISGKLSIGSFLEQTDKYKPILRPLSDLAKNEFKKQLDTICICEDEDEWLEGILSMLPLGDWQILFKLHFDVFDLIPNDLAIDINTIKK